ncbi:NAD-dependent epimerase/dehydratase family protein [Microbacterium sp. 179-I 3D4 NHS]|uniref:NAD-dependent epimerase/dehydratase family protein n=1 Tax=Microbacterium sp. 179-I 3D4 NHS TaxID=3142381 RepID=UPI0039A2701C
MTPVDWVIGARGLLGSAVVRSLSLRGTPAWRGPVIRWGGPEAEDDLRAGVEHLVAHAGDRPWRVFWCAGVGVTGSSAASLHTEVARFESLLAAIAALPPEVRERGLLFVASSAGAMYAGSHGAPFDESTPPHPLGDYGLAKQEIERAAERFAAGASVRCVVGRIANLYGPGQSLAKPQGLISHLCRAHVRRTPLSVYVPLDTLRDYIFVDDCAALVLATCERLVQEPTGAYRMKVLASGRSVSIGALLGEFRRVVGRRPEIVMGSSPVSALQSRDLRMRSTVWPDLDQRASTNLADGIARTLQGIRLTMAVAS